MWVHVGTDVYIPHCKCQVKPLSAPWFSGAFGDSIVYRNDFFVCSSRINFLHLI